MSRSLWPKRKTKTEVRPLRRLALLVLLLFAACTETSVDTTTTVAPTVPSTSSTTTTLPDPCPDVFCVVYSIRPGSMWSDGTPVTADDFAFTLSLFNDPDGVASGNSGYDLITGFEVVDPATILIAFSEDYAAYPTLFASVFPAHLDYSPDHPAASAGPYQIDSLDDAEIRLVRNPHYPVSGGTVEEIVLVRAEGTRELVSAMASGGLDLIAPEPLGWVIDEFDGMSGVEHRIDPGPFWEHVTFNHSDPLLAQPWFREALALAVDWDQVVEATVGTVTPEVVGVTNTMWMSSSPFHRAHADIEYDPARALEIFQNNGCEREGSGPLSCDGRQVSLVWATTTGDSFRSNQIELASADLAEIGVEIVPWRLPPAQLFSEPILFGDHSVWQLISFAWNATPDPEMGLSMYQCSGTGSHGMGLLNVARFCDPEVDRLVAESSAQIDPSARAETLNQVDDIYLSGHSIVPLYQQPHLTAWSQDLIGPSYHLWAGPLWNAAEWTGATEVRVGVLDPPIALHTAVPIGDTEAMVFSLIQRGAFRVDADGQFQPDLVSGVEILSRSAN